MQEKVMEFILTFLLILFLVGWILKILVPLLLTWYIKRKMSKGGGTGFGSFGPFAGGFYTGAAQAENREDDSKRNKEQEGKVTVVTMEEKEKVIEDNMGEYIDFEEEKES